MVSDDELSTVGSTNVDFRSFEHNFEVNAFIYDTENSASDARNLPSRPARLRTNIPEELGEAPLVS